MTGYTQWEWNSFLPVPVWKYKQHANSNKKILPVSRWETLCFLCCCDSLWDYSNKNAICRDGQTCWENNKNLSGMLTHCWGHRLFFQQRSLALKGEFFWVWRRKKSQLSQLSKGKAHTTSQNSPVWSNLWYTVTYTHTHIHTLFPQLKS